ncbi:MAG: hypothetical protein U9N30_08780 [Campylobacterota bacterium]|nr:hypothetical protein [Campylobacterota bacterium]
MMKIVNFNDLEEKDFLELENLDAKFVQKYGDSFADSYWSCDNFSYVLPLKYALSYVVTIDGIIEGYCVASLKNDCIYVHRFAVNSNTKIRSNFFNELLKQYGNKKIYLMVNVVNNAAINFYNKFNFKIVEEIKEINSFIAQDLNVNKEEIIITEDYRCYLMKKI